MKATSFRAPAWVTAAAALLAGCLTAGAAAQEFPELRGPYFGQQPPRSGVEVFSPGILKPENGFHSSVVFNSSGDEACWTEMAKGKTLCSRIVNGLWTEPRGVPFDREYGVREPMFAHSDRRLYYLSRRPLTHDPVTRERIWFVDRTPSGWSAPTVIDQVVAAHPTHWQFSLTSRGDLYFTSEIEGVRGEQDIFVSRWRDGKFAEPSSLGDRVNSDQRDFCPFIAPDESYLIFSRSVPEERGRSDLFISFRGADGQWSKAVNMGDTINSEHNEVSPVVTPDGRHLFFLRVSGNINDVFWTSAEVIESLRRKTESGSASSNRPISETELLAGMEEFERSIRNQPRHTKQQRLQDQADEYMGRMIEVANATVASRYHRENRSRIYFGYNYDQGDHLYLRDLDPTLDRDLENHRHWVSVVKTYALRQISFEIPVDSGIFERIDRGEAVSFSCRIAALIRGRSVYCAPTDGPGVVLGG